MQKFKKTVSGFIAICMSMVTLSMSISAENSDETMMFNTLDEYIEYSIPRHLYAQQIETSNMLTYSNPISLYDFSSNTIVGSEIFLIDNGQLIGKMDVYNSDDDYSSYFDTNITDEMVDAYTNGDKIAIGSFENSILLYTDSEGFSFVDGLDNNNIPIKSPTELSSIIEEGTVSSDFILPYSIATYNLSVPIVDNSNTYDSSGQCWAAAVAMKINYHKGLNLTADSVYEELTDANIDFSTNGTSKALKHFGYSNYVNSYSAMNSGDVALALKDDKPIIMHIANKSNENSAITHAVVISGIVLDVSSSTYTIKDPNYSTARTLNTSNNPNVENTTIHYVSVGYTFIKWYNTFY